MPAHERGVVGLPSPLPELAQVGPRSLSQVVQFALGARNQGADVAAGTFLRFGTPIPRNDPDATHATYAHQPRAASFVKH